MTSQPCNGKSFVQTQTKIWTSQWSVILRTFYRQIFSLLYSSFFFWNFRHRLARELLVRHARQGVWQNQCVIRMMSGLCTWDVKWHIMLLTFQHWFYFIVRGFSWCLFVCLLVLGSCVKVRSIVTIRCHTLHWVYLFWFFFQRGTVLCMSSQRLFHGKFVFGALVRSKKTFGGWFQICSISCPCWGLGKKSNGLRCFFLLASFNYLLWFSNRRTP